MLAHLVLEFGIFVNKNNATHHVDGGRKQRSFCRIIMMKLDDEGRKAEYLYEFSISQKYLHLQWKLQGRQIDAPMSQVASHSPS